jgi:hypothetical protein
MAKLISGMAPVTETKIDGGSQTTRRPQRLPELQPLPSAGPQARSVDTYVPVRAPQGAGDGFLALAQGLQGLAPALDRFVADRADKEKTRQEASADAKIGGMTLDQQREFVKSGQIDQWEGGWARARYMNLYGANAGMDAAGAVLQQYDSPGFDKIKGDVGALIAQGQQAMMQALPGDPHAQQQAARSFAQLTDKLRLQQRSDRTQDFKQGVVDNTTPQVLKVIAEAKANGSGTAGMLAGIKRIKDGNVHTGAQTPAEFDDGLAPALQALVDQGDPDTLVAIMSDDRGGVGPLSQTAKYAGRYNAWVEQAAAKQVENNQKAAGPAVIDIAAQVQAGTFDLTKAEIEIKNKRMEPQAAYKLVAQSNVNLQQERDKAAKAQAKLEAQQASAAATQAVHNDALRLAEEGNFVLAKDREVPNATGTGTTTITVVDQAKEIRQAYYTEIDRAAVQGNLPTAAKAKLLANKFAGNGIDDTRTQGILQTSFVGARSVDFQKGTEQYLRLADAYETYRATNEFNPTYAQTLTKDAQTKQFYQDMDALISNGYSFDQAANSSLQLSAIPADQRGRGQMSAGDQATLDEAVKDATKIGAQGWFSGNYADNIGTVGPRVRDQAKRLMDLGLSPPEAAAQAAKTFAAGHILVNGYAIPNNSRDYKANIGEQLTAQVQRIYGTLSDDEKGDYSPEDLTLTQDGNAAGRWRLVDKFGNPIGRNYVSMDDIAAADQASRDAHDRQMTEQADKIAAQQRANQEFLALPQTVRRARPHPTTE